VRKVEIYTVAGPAPDIYRDHRTYINAARNTLEVVPVKGEGDVPIRSYNRNHIVKYFEYDVPQVMFYDGENPPKWVDPMEGM
jgi:hypothetical protein